MRKLLVLPALFLLAAFALAQSPYSFSTISSNGTAMGASSGTVQFRMNACVTGWTEQSSLADKTILVTTAAAMDAGTTGGSNTITPTVASLVAAAQTWTGNAITSVINHTHPVTDPGHTHLTQRYPTATGASSGFTIDTSMSGTLADNTLPTKTATTGVTTSNPAGGVASITPTGSNGTSSVSGTLNQFDNRSAWVKMIVCVKD